MSLHKFWVTFVLGQHRDVAEHRNTTVSSWEDYLELQYSCRFPHLGVQCAVVHQVLLLLVSVLRIALNLNDLCLLTPHLEVKKGMSESLALEVT